jgi:hypothetical protein
MHSNTTESSSKSPVARAIAAIKAVHSAQATAVFHAVDGWWRAAKGSAGGFFSQKKRINFTLHYISSCRTSKKSAQGSEYCV